MTNVERSPNNKIRITKRRLNPFCFWICSFIRHSLLVLLCSLSICFGQRQPDRSAPADPAQAEREARSLIADLLAQKPEAGSTKIGRLQIRDAKGDEKEVPVRIEILTTTTNWMSIYEATG